MNSPNATPAVPPESTLRVARYLEEILLDAMNNGIIEESDRVRNPGCPAINFSLRGDENSSNTDLANWCCRRKRGRGLPECQNDRDEYKACKSSKEPPSEICCRLKRTRLFHDKNIKTCDDGGCLRFLNIKYSNDDYGTPERLEIRYRVPNVNVGELDSKGNPIRQNDGFIDENQLYRFLTGNKDNPDGFINLDDLAKPPPFN